MDVLIVDDHEVVRDGLVATLASIEDLTIVGAVSTGAEALSLARRSVPDVALVDLLLPDISGQELCRELLEISRSLSVVILSSYLSEGAVRDSLQAGAYAYVTKSAGVPRLKAVLAEIRADPHQRVPVHNAPLVAKQLDHLAAGRKGALRITPRQERIIELAAEGLTNRAISEQLCISESTVRFHIQNLKQRLGANRRAELVAKAIRMGVVPPAPDDARTPSVVLATAALQNGAPRRPTPEQLDYTATSAKNGLRCDCVVITWLIDGEMLVGADGLDPAERQELHGSLKAIADTLRRGNGAPAPQRPTHFAAINGLDQHLASPMILGGRTIGVLHVLNRGAAGPIDPVLVETLAGYCADALQYERLCSPMVAQHQPHLAAIDELAFYAEDLTDLIPLLESALRPIFGAVRIGLMVWDDERRVLQMVRGSFGAPEHVTASYQADVGESRGNATRVYRLLRAYARGRGVDDPVLLKEYADAFGIEHLLCAPLGDNDRHTGVLHVARTGRAFSVAEIRRCDEILSRVVMAVESVRIRMRLSMQRQVEAVLSRQAVAIASGTWSNDGLRQALEELRELFDASIIALVPSESPPLVAIDPATPAITEQLLLEGARTERRERTDFERPEGAGNPGSATLYVPVHLGTRVVGMLATLRNRYLSFTAEERHGLSRMADLIALSWASERYQQHRAALARLAERQRIADELHNDVAQILFAAQMQLAEALAHESVPQTVRSPVAQARTLLTRADEAIRNVIVDLSRPQPAALPNRLYDVVETIEQEFMLPVHLEVSPEAEAASRRTRRAVADTIVEVAREALVNAAKHAGPCRTSVTLALASDQRLRLRVSDTGSGNPARQQGSAHGLASLRRSVSRHGGSLRVTRGRTSGTTVTVTMPL